MKLSAILQGIRYSAKDALDKIDSASVVCDSRHVKKGALFIALRGHDRDGYEFIESAIAKGADAIIAEKPFSAPKHIIKVHISDIVRALPVIARNFYSDPATHLSMIGVTGTNGKTTVTYIIEQILAEASREVGVIGTINYRYKGNVRTATNTTPGPLELQYLLRGMVDAGVTCALMEVSSHSLDQSRIGGIGFDTAIFTNITCDHLDYHLTRERYFEAKALLLKYVKPTGCVILNIDDPLLSTLRGRISGRVITYGISHNADVVAKEIKLGLSGSSCVIDTPRGILRIETPLIGRHNISNILASIAAVIDTGIKLEVIEKALAHAKVAPGRLEGVDVGQPFKVFVDFAHTEDALNNVLGLLRELCGSGRIITVFGCGGNRDRGKRPLMGKAACLFSDVAMITSDNPRFEEPMAIIGEIEEGIRGAFDNYRIIPDRETAIEAALNEARKGDIVLIAGKGHESSQIVKGTIFPFDDCAIAKKILKKKFT